MQEEGEHNQEMKVTDPQKLPIEIPEQPKDADFRITGEARIWKGLFGTIAMLSDEATIAINKRGIHVKVMDPAHVAMAEISIDMEAFEEWKVKTEGEIGLDVAHLAGWLTDTKDDELVTIETKDGMIIYTTPEIKRFMNRVDTTGMSRPKIPNLNLKIAFTLPFKTLQRTIKLIGKSDIDHITFTAKNQTIIIRAEDTGYKGLDKFVYAEKTYGRNDVINFTVLGKIATKNHEEETSLFPQDYLEYPFKTGKNSPWRLFKGKNALIENITLTIGTDYPILMEGKGTNVRFKYLLAPRIESE